MDFIFIPFLGFGLFCLAKKLAQVTKMEPIVIYILVGILLGLLLNISGLGNITKLFPHISMYNSIALLFMFFVSGFNINIARLKKSGKITAKLLCIPAYVETFFISIAIYFILKLIPIAGISLSYVESLIIAAIFSVSSPANTLPVCADLIRTGYTDKNNMPSTMIVVSIIDGFITVPIVFVSIFIILTQNRGMPITTSNIFNIIGLILLGIVVSILVGVIFGRLELLIAKSIFKKLSGHNQSMAANYFVIVIAFVLALIFALILHSVDVLSKVITIFGILIMCGIGLSINNYDKTGTNVIIRRYGNKIFSCLGTPIIFMYVGAIIDIYTLLNPFLLIVLFAITILAFTIKGKTAKVILRGNEFTDGERKFVSDCFIPKGVTLINFSIIFGTLLVDNPELLEFMRMLAAVSIIFTMGLGMASLHKVKDNLLFKNVKEIPEVIPKEEQEEAPDIAQPVIVKGVLEKD